MLPTYGDPKAGAGGGAALRARSAAPRNAAGGATTGGGSRTLSRGLAVLHFLGTAADGATVAELSTATALDRAVLYRLLDTLSDHGFVSRDPDTRKFHLGVALVELGARAGRSLEVRRLALPAMRLLMEQVREAVCLAVRDRGDVVVVDRVEPSGLFVRVGYHVGFRHPLRVGAHGRALLAHLEQSERDGLLDGHPGLSAEVEATRVRGFAVSADELERGASGVAAPIVDRSGRPIASLGIVAPSPRMPDPAALGPRVRGLAVEVSKRLGFASADAR